MICTTIPNLRKPMFIAITLAVLALAFVLQAPAQQLARRLILKDGTYQLVTTYEIKGDRVRYKSSERDEWEELPSALVDWPATEKYEKDRAASAIPEAAAIDKEADKEIDADRETALSRLPQVAPGLRLPDYSGVFLLDNFQGQPQLVELQQSEGDINHDTKANLLRGIIPAAGAKQTVELEGEHAAVHAHVAVPSIYINVEDDSAPPSGQTSSAELSQPNLDAPRPEQQGSERQGPQQPQQPEQALVPFNRFHIVQTKVKSGKRIVGDLKRAPNGKISQDQNFVKTTIDRVSGGWFKLTPTEDLAPGEYVLIETKGNEGMNLYVWDFNVNPSAPANANPWKPDAKPAEPEKPKENL
ncbi:MAG: hypothetical protein WBY96_00110 [Candidatus Sulfotelmatobacter sp.]